MKIQLPTFVVLFVVYSCGVPKKEHQDLISENDSLRNEIEILKNKSFEILENYNNLLEDIEQEKSVIAQKIYVSDLEALSYLKDYYEFYDRDKVYRNPSIRRTDRNTFIISLEECNKRGDYKEDDFFWNAVVKELIVNNDKTYSLEKKWNL